MTQFATKLVEVLAASTEKKGGKGEAKVSSLRVLKDPALYRLAMNMHKRAIGDEHIGKLPTFMHALDDLLVRFGAEAEENEKDGKDKETKGNQREADDE